MTAICAVTGKRIFITAPAAYRAIADLCRKHKARCEARTTGRPCGSRCTCSPHWHIGHGGGQ